MTRSRITLLIGLLLLALAAVVVLWVGAIIAYSQTRISPEEVCRRNGEGWTYVPATGICYGPGTHIPTPPAVDAP